VARGLQRAGGFMQGGCWEVERGVSGDSLCKIGNGCVLGYSFVELVCGIGVQVM